MTGWSVPGVLSATRKLRYFFAFRLLKRMIGWKGADIPKTKSLDLEFEGVGDPVSKTGRVLLGLCEAII